MGILDKALQEALKQGAKKGKKAPHVAKEIDPVLDRVRTAFPGIYDDPREIAAKAAANVAPEDPALRQLFGVTRDDLYEEATRRDLGVDSIIKFKDGARGSQHVKNVMTDANRDRIVGVLDAAGEYPELHRGMDAWYVMDPAYQRLLELTGDPQVAGELFRDFNTYTSLASPGSDVLTEINRGTAANWLAAQGRFDDFARYGGKEGGAGAPIDMIGIKGHPYHSTTHVGPMRPYAERGEIDMQSAKVPAYLQAAMPDELGRSWRVPAADAHFTRAIGVSDTRRGESAIGASMNQPEVQTVLPWWDQVASDAGLLPVPAQARLWGTMSHATGVDTAVGAPKLELLAQRIMRAAEREGVDPEVMRDLVLLGGRVGKVAAPSAGLLAAAGVPAFAEEERPAAIGILDYLTTMGAR